ATCVAAETPTDSFGASIAGGHDLDGDGVDDLAVGAPTAGGVLAGPGAVYVFSGGAGIPAADTEATVTIRGLNGLDALGTSVAVMDLDDDGVADLMIGAPGVDGLVADAGDAYAFFGPLTAGVYTAADAGLRFEGGLPQRHLGAPGNALAGSIGSADVNGDGVLDLLVSQGGTDADADHVDSGVAFLYLGPLVRGTVSAPGYADVVFEGTRAGEYASEPVDGAGDLTGDGLDDVVVAANGLTPERIAVFSGPTDGKRSLDNADLLIEPASTGEGTGWSLGTGHDVDGDGAVDLVVGSPYGGPATEGEVRVVLGAVGTGTLALADHPAIVGGAPGSELGKSIAMPGDVDGDGLGDFAVGAPQSDYGAGAIVLFSGF
ncbi:MAG: VCBS repeat-containing protein, partial [Myxococcota bacterium]